MQSLASQRLERLYRSELGSDGAVSGRWRDSLALNGQGVLSIGEPEYEGPHRRLLEDYTQEAANGVGKYLQEELGKSPYFGGIKVRIEKLPTQYAIVVSEDGVGIVPVGKIFGYYDPRTDEIGIDPVVFEELDDFERGMLESYFEIPNAKRVIGEELIHSDQKRSGSMAKALEYGPEKGRARIEGAAAYIADLLFGKTRVYEPWKADFERRVESEGLRDAYTEGLDRLGREFEDSMAGLETNNSFGFRRR